MYENIIEMPKGKLKSYLKVNLLVKGSSEVPPHYPEILSNQIASSRQHFIICDAKNQHREWGEMCTETVTLLHKHASHSDAGRRRREELNLKCRFTVEEVLQGVCKVDFKCELFWIFMTKSANGNWNLKGDNQNTFKATFVFGANRNILSPFVLLY